MTLPSDVVTFLSSIIVLTRNGKYLDYASIAFSERYVGVEVQLFSLLEAEG